MGSPLPHVAFITVSAFSWCAVAVATPATAGGALLARQYLSGSEASGAAAADSVFAQHQLAVGSDLGWNSCKHGMNDQVID